MKKPEKKKGVMQASAKRLRKAWGMRSALSNRKSTSPISIGKVDDAPLGRNKAFGGAV